jgi:hypothetical protein
VTIIDPQRDLHNAQKPGVLVSDPVSFVCNGICLINILTVVGAPPGAL